MRIGSDWWDSATPIRKGFGAGIARKRRLTVAGRETAREPNAKHLR
jgi:hypothetical protein